MGTSPIVAEIRTFLNTDDDPMKLTLKIIVLFLVVACGLVGVSGYLSVQREVAFF